MAEIPAGTNKTHALIIKEYVSQNADLVEARREVDRLRKLLRLVHQHARTALEHEYSPGSICEPLRVELRWLVVIATTGGIGEPDQVDAPTSATDPRRAALPDIQGPALDAGDGKLRP